MINTNNNNNHHRGYSAVGLFCPKNNYNIGGVLRAAACFDVSIVTVYGKRYKKHSSDTAQAWKHTPFIETDDLFSLIPYSCVPVAIELVANARSLCNYTHPERAYYIFGPEDGSLGNNILSKCRDIVYIPTNICMNLAACVNVVLYDRLLKFNK